MRLTRAITLFAAGAATAWYLDRRRPLPGVEHPAMSRPPDASPSPAAHEPPEEVTPEPPEDEHVHEPMDEEPVEEEPVEDEPVDEVNDAPPEPAVAASSRRGPPPVPGPGARRGGREAHPPPDPAFAGPSEQPTVEQPAVERGAEPADVAAVVDDLIGSGAPNGDEHAIVDAELVEEMPVREPPNDPQITVAVLVELGKVPGLVPEAVGVEVTDGVVWLEGEIDDPATIGEVERRIGALEGVERVRSLLHLSGASPRV